MSLITIILFFIYTYGLGFTLTKFLKNSDDFWERNIMRIGIGLGIIPILSVIFNLLRIPIDWKVFLVLSIVFPLYCIFKNMKSIKLPSLKFKLTKSSLYVIIVLLAFLITFGMYHKGSFIYPWLEDGDPYDVAVMTKYIATYKTFTRPAGTEDLRISHYAPPYTTAYNVLMAILHQTSPSLNWTLKFFNALIVSLSTIFIYFFVKKFTNNKKIALFSTIAFAAIPSTESHFIFAEQLAFTLFFPALYALECSFEDKKWAFISAAITSSILITQFSAAATFGALFFVPYWIIKAALEKKLLKYVFLAGALGVALSFLYWGPMISKYGWEKTNPLTATKGTDKPSDWYRAGTSYLYTLGDFIWAKDFWPNARSGNKIDQPIGIGIIASLIVLVSLALIILNYEALLRKENAWLLISVAWLIGNFAATYGNPLITFNPHRGWSFLAIAVAIIIGKGIFDLGKLAGAKGMPAPIIIIPLLVLVIITSGISKYNVNTAFWPQHYANPVTEIAAYAWLATLPENTKVTSLCKSDAGPIAFDKFSSADWDREMLNFKKSFINITASGMHSFLEKKGYQYVISDYGCVDQFGINETISKLNEMVQSGLFQPAYQQEYQGQKLLTIIFKI